MSDYSDIDASVNNLLVKAIKISKEEEKEEKKEEQEDKVRIKQATSGFTVFSATRNTVT